MNNKGFTLIEVVTAVVIMSLLGTIAVTSMMSVLKSGNDKYYKNQEDMVIMAAKEYYSDHKGELPIESDTSTITLDELIESDYIDTVKDSKGNICNGQSTVTVSKIDNKKYKYKVELDCPRKNA